MTTKERLERFLSDTPIKPVMRTKINEIDVYVADGFITPEMYRGAEIKFAVPIERDKFPNGCFATMWYADIEPAAPSAVAYSEPLHDIESIGLNARQSARINAVLAQARKDTRLGVRH